MPAFNYSSTAGEYSLTGPITPSATSLTLNSVTGLPVTPFKLVIEPGGALEEIVKVTNVAGTTCTIVRGWDGTAGASHAALVKVRHMLTAEDLRLSRQHEDATVAHGATGAVVGTTNAQQLTNKDLTSGTNTFPTNLATLTGSQVLSNKDLTAGTNTFPTSLATLTGSQTLTNKNLTSGTNTFPTSLVTLTGTQSLTNKTFTDKVTINQGAVQPGLAVTCPNGTDITTWANGVGGVAKLSSNAFEVNGGAFKVYYPVDASLVKIQTLVTAPAVDVRPIVVKGAVSQTANLQEWRNSGDVVIASVDASGDFAAANIAQAPNKAGQRFHWGTFTGTTDGSSELTITHGCGFTPTTVVPMNNQISTNQVVSVHTITSTTCKLVWRTAAGGTLASTSVGCAVFFGE